MAAPLYAPQGVELVIKGLIRPARDPHVKRLENLRGLVDKLSFMYFYSTLRQCKITKDVGGISKG